MRLEPAHYLGSAVRQRRIGGLVLTLCRYEPGLSEPWHVHANPTFFLLVAGRQRDCSRQMEFDQDPLTAVFHPTTEPHSGFVGPRGMVGLNVEYDHTWLDSHGIGKQELGGYQPLASIWSRLAFIQLLGNAFRETPVARGDIETIALELLDPVFRFPFSPRRTTPPWLHRAMSMLRDQFRSPITLRIVAAEVGVHPVHLARVFRREKGCSVSEYLRALRVAEASRLIVDAGRPLAEAACEAGFADQPHLCRVFSSTFGFTPKTLRMARQSLRAPTIQDSSALPG